MALDDTLRWEYDWEKDEIRKAEKLTKEEIENRLKIMELMYIDRFAEHMIGLELLMFAWKEEEHLESGKECYSFLLNNYEKRYKEKFKQLDYMREVNEIYEILNEFGELLEEYSNLPREKEEMKKYYAEKMEPKIVKMGKLSKIWGYRLNLYRGIIGKKPINFEVKKFLN